MNRSIALAAFTLPGLLTSCGSGMTANDAGKPADWAADACKTFPASAATKAAGVAVAKVESSGQTGNELTLVSNCTYSTANGKTNFGVLLRQAKAAAESIDAQIAELKSQPDMTGPSEDVAMPKGKAIWAPRIGTLSYFPDNRRMIAVTPPGAISLGIAKPSSADLKAKAIAIATAIEG